MHSASASLLRAGRAFYPTGAGTCNVFLRNQIGRDARRLSQRERMDQHLQLLLHGLVAGQQGIPLGQKLLPLDSQCFLVSRQGRGLFLKLLLTLRQPVAQTRAELAQFLVPRGQAFAQRQ
jgi:hypothetical protein